MLLLSVNIFYVLWDLTPGQYVRLNLCITQGHCGLTMG